MEETAETNNQEMPNDQVVNPQGLNRGMMYSAANKVPKLAFIAKVKNI